MPKGTIEIRMAGGLNNRMTGLDLFLRKLRENQVCVNVDTTYDGQIRRYAPLLPLNSGAGSNLRTLFVADGIPFLMDGAALKYGNGLTTLIALLSSNKVYMDQVGDWLFIGTGDAKKAVYIPTLTVCDWGIAVPTVAPTLTPGTGTLNGTYSCYYRYAITLPDGTLIRTALSPVADLSPATASIEWSDIPVPTFGGATAVQIELFRTKAGWADIYLVQTITAGTTTYSDDLGDPTLQAATLLYAETGFYPPPSFPSIVRYYDEADRVFVSLGGDVYWSEPAEYHIFLYNAIAGDYESVNSVFLGSESITAIKLIDENLYFSSPKRWRRLRGRSPASWDWEDISSATAGAMSQESATETPFGIIFPYIDGRIWLFDGYSTRPILEDFIFTTPPDANSHATYDGRFWRLFYSDPTYPELVVDFLKYPGQPPKIVQSTRSATCSFFDRMTAKLYMADAHYLRQGKDTTTQVPISLRTAEVPPEDLSVLGDMATLVLGVDTKGDSLTITPRYDRTAQSPLTPTVTNSMQDVELPIPFGTNRRISFDLSINTAKEIIIEEPLVLRKSE
jgi:hypothetical protein